MFLLCRPAFPGIWNSVHVSIPPNLRYTAMFCPFPRWDHKFSQDRVRQGFGSQWSGMPVFRFLPEFRFFVSPNLRVFIYFWLFWFKFTRFFRFFPSVSGFLSGTDWHPWMIIGSFWFAWWMASLTVKIKRCILARTVVRSFERCRIRKNDGWQIWRMRTWIKLAFQLSTNHFLCKLKAQ